MPIPGKMSQAVDAKLSVGSKAHLARTASSIGCVQRLVQESSRRARSVPEWALKELAVVAPCTLKLVSAKSILRFVVPDGDIRRSLPGQCT